jgi:hypothetical protein
MGFTEPQAKRQSEQFSRAVKNRCHHPLEGKVRLHVRFVEIVVALADLK